jgi:hypothetical protein
VNTLPTKQGLAALTRLFLITVLSLACALQRLPPGLGADDSPVLKPTVSPLPAPTPTPAPGPGPQPGRGVREGYGINLKGLNYDDDSLDKAIALDFEWIKIYDHPPPERLPFKVLYRVNLPRGDEDWAEWGHYRFLDAQLYADRVDAWEIGNEPNLIEEWHKPPDPAAYAELLQIAYREIKAADPDAMIVSAGLAPVSARGDSNHLNDLDFTRGMYAHGAADHFDVLGIHAFGFAQPPEMPPDGTVCPSETLGRSVYVRVEGPEIDRGCWPVEGLVFRRAEQIRAIMVEYGDGTKPVWATEFGWLIRPLPCCLSHSDWYAQAWHAVSEGRQARYLLRAYRYAEDNWPWMQVMFLWNLDWSRYQARVERCGYCETMGAYSILDPDGSPRLAYEWLVEEEGN